MPKPYVRNHTIPQSILRRWVPAGSSYVPVYLVRQKRKLSASAEGTKPFSFAIGNDLYIPRLNGERATAVERWFSDQETALAKLVAQLHARTEPLALTAWDLNRALMGIVGLECRSRYNIRAVQEVIERNPEARATVSANPERPTKQLSLENLIHYVTEWSERLWPVEMTVVFADGPSWVLSDRPYILDAGLDHRFVVLTNKVLLAYRRSPDGMPSYLYRPTTPGFQATVNHMIALNAREWLVTDTEAQLDEFVPIFDSDEWREFVGRDAPRMERPRMLRSGWSIRPD